MLLPLMSTNITAFDLNGGDVLALFKTAKPGFDNDLVDASGAADDGEFNLLAKAGHTFDFTVMQLGTGGTPVPDTNLQISLWSFGGTAYLGALRGGSINAGIKTAEGSSIAAGYKVPVPAKRTLEVSTDLMIFDTADLANLGFTGTAAEMAMTVALTWGTTVFSCPMTMKSGSVTVEDSKTIMQNVTFSRRGSPTSPSDSSLMGKILVGTGVIGFSLTSDGGDVWNAASALLTRLSCNFADGALLNLEGSCAVQGAIAITAPDDGG